MFPAQIQLNEKRQNRAHKEVQQQYKNLEKNKAKMDS